MVNEKIIHAMVQYYQDNFFQRGILLPYPIEAFIAQEINTRENTVQAIEDMRQKIDALNKQLDVIQNQCGHWQIKMNVDGRIKCEDCGKVLK